MDKYIVEKSDELHKLEERVNFQIRNGYVPIGGICVNVNVVQTEVAKGYHQAMIRG